MQIIFHLKNLKSSKKLLSNIIVCVKHITYFNLYNAHKGYGKLSRK